MDIKKNHIETGKKGGEAEELVPHPHVAIKNQKGYLCSGDPHWRSKGSQPYPNLPSPEHQCWEEESTQQLAVKISSYSVLVISRLLETQMPSNRPEHRLTCSQTFALLGKGSSSKKMLRK